MAVKTNPFSTRFVKPGALNFHFPKGVTITQLMKRFDAAKSRGEIVGPHGCGKSTLIAELLKRIQAEKILITIHTNESKTSKFVETTRSIQNAFPGSLVVIDGFEQFTRRQRLDIIQAIDSSGCGLLVSCHQSVGLPTLIHLHADLQRFREVVNKLLAGHEIQLSQRQIDLAFKNHQPNIREALFSLYDIYEIQRRSSDR